MGRLAGRKPISLAVVALLALGLALASCGGDDDSTTGDTTPAAQPENERQATGGGDEQAGDGAGKQGSKPGGESGSDDSGSGGGDTAARQHDDSGGGSEQFRVKGGDNSIQEFGSEASESEFDEAAAAVHGFFDARAGGDWATACSFLAGDVADSLKQLTGNSKALQGQGCAGILEALSRGVPKSALRAAAVADIGSLRVEGDRAFVIYRGTQDTVFAIAVKKEDGRWKVASLAGTPLS
ncbi:MAG: hypothetical protein WD404_05900 [Solirubrobacterales bacterium]